MDKNVRPYKQRGNTCAIVCMLMILEYYKIIEKIYWYDERRLYKRYCSKYINGTPFSAIAFHLSKNNLETTIYHENKNLFKNKYGIINDSTFKLAIDEYKKYLDFAKDKGTKIVNGINININILKEKLEEDNLIILAGEISGIYHSILLTGYDEFGFKVCDPLYKDKQIKTFDEIENFMNTNIGKWFISVKNIKN